MNCRHTIVCLLAILTIIGAGCAKPILPVASPNAPTVDEQRIGGEWMTITDRIERMEYHFAPNRFSNIILYRFDPKSYAFRFETGEPKTVAGWAATTSNAALIVNGVYFHEDFTPSGLLITDGKRVNDREFDFNKTGLIVLAPEVMIINTASALFDINAFTEAAQSYPFLVRSGKPAVASDSGQTARRTFIGLDVDGRVYLGVVPATEVSLFELAAVLSEMDIAWDNVLNLDGGPSTGLAARSEEFRETVDSFTPVPNVIVVERY